jgi:LuxR family maltose regulon positive regulatory protein
LIDAGLTNQQIADRLSIAPSTVKTHINNIYGKLWVETRVQELNPARGLNLMN